MSASSPEKRVSKRGFMAPREPTWRNATTTERLITWATRILYGRRYVTIRP
jgi:hypothetical protein